MATANYTPTACDITIIRGDTPPIAVNVTDTSGDAVDVTGATFLMTVDTSPEPANSDNNLFQVSGVITDAAAGAVLFALSAVNTAQPAGEYYYDIQMTQSGVIRTLLKGAFTVNTDITK